MNCQQAQRQLAESLAAGQASLRPEITEHCDSCPMCQAFYRREEKLFATLEAGLQGIVNQPVPSSLFPRVRAGLEQAPAARDMWIPVGSLAGVVTIIVVVSLAMFWNSTNHHHVQEPMRVASLVAHPYEPEPALPVHTTNPALRSVHPPKGAPMHPREIQQPATEVIVRAEERQSFAELVADSSERENVAAALNTPAPAQGDSPVEIALLHIVELEIVPLESEPQE